jgi:hypothetical protein
MEGIGDSAYPVSVEARIAVKGSRTTRRALEASSEGDPRCEAHAAVLMAPVRGGRRPTSYWCRSRSPKAAG